MPAFRISKDHFGVLRLQRRAYPLMSLQEQETFELSGAVYGYLVQRSESLDAPQFLARIHASCQSSDPRQFEIERVIGLCMERQQSDLAQRPALDEALSSSAVPAAAEESGLEEIAQAHTSRLVAHTPQAQGQRQ